MLTHPFAPSGLTKDSKILILGSFPSVASREAGFYYAHPRNRFWKLLGLLFQEESILTIPPAVFLETTPNTPNTQNAPHIPNTHNYKQSLPPLCKATKIAFLKSHFLVLWDIVYSCEIISSSDCTLKNVAFNDIFALLHASKIETICLNGTKATMLFKQYCKNQNSPLILHSHSHYKTLIPMDSQKFRHKIVIFSLPSTSPANARYNLDSLLNAWSILLKI